MSQEYLDKVKLISYWVTSIISALCAAITLITFFTPKTKFEEFRKDLKYRKRNLIFFLAVFFISGIGAINSMPDTNSDVKKPEKSNPPPIPPDTTSKEPTTMPNEPREIDDSIESFDTSLQVIADLNEENQEIKDEIQKIEIFVPLPREGYGLLIIRAENVPHYLNCVIDSGYHYWLRREENNTYAERRFELRPGVHILRFIDQYGLLFRKLIKIDADKTYLKEFTHLYPYGEGIGRLVISPLKNVPCLLKFEYSRDSIVEYLVANKPLTLDLQEGTYDMTFSPKIESKLKLEPFKRVEIGAGHLLSLEISDRE